MYATARNPIETDISANILIVDCRPKLAA